MASSPSPTTPPPSAIGLGKGSKGACANPETNARYGPGSGLFPWASSSQIDLIKENWDNDEKTVEEAERNMGFEHRGSHWEGQESDGQRPKALVKLCLSPSRATTLPRRHPLGPPTPKLWPYFESSWPRSMDLNGEATSPLFFEIYHFLQVCARQQTSD